MEPVTAAFATSNAPPPIEPKTTLKLWLPEIVKTHKKGLTQTNTAYALDLQKIAPKDWSLRSIENELSILTKVSQNSSVRPSHKRSHKNEK
jgi:hypothetical protein